MTGTIAEDLTVGRPIAEDLIINAGPIAIEIYGRDDEKARRDVYRNVLGLTIFKHGNSLAAFRSTIRREVREIEDRARRARQGAAA